MCASISNTGFIDFPDSKLRVTLKRTLCLKLKISPLDIRNGPTPLETVTDPDCGVVADKTGNGGDNPENVF